MTRTTHRKRHARTDVLTGAYARLRREGVPSFVTSHEAYRMTDGRVGTKGDHNLRHGFTLMALVKKADGDLHSPKVGREACDHDERVAVPGLSDVEACMDCGATFTQPEDDGTVAEARAEVQVPAPVGGTIVEVAEPKRPRLRLLLEGDGRVTEGGYWSLYGRKGRLDGVWTQRFAARVVLPEYVTVINTYEERRTAAN